MDLCEQSPSYIRAIAPYQPGKPISELAREMGLAEKKIVKLASNENPLAVSPKAKAAIKKALAELARYPDGNAFELKAALSRRHGVPQECIVVGNGSNDLLEMAAGAFLAPGRAAVYSQHAFAVYPLATQARGDHAGNAGGVYRQSEQSHGDIRDGRGDREFSFARAPRRGGGRGRSLHRLSAAEPALRQRRPAEEISQLYRHTHLFQGLRPGGASRRLRSYASGRRGAAEPRAPALQRQQP